MNNELCIETIKRFPFYDKLNENEINSIKENVLFRNCNAGMIINTGGGHECLGMVFVCEGMLRCYMLSEEGREITLFRISAGNSCVFSASCVLSQITFDVFIEAETDSRIMILNAQAFSHLTDTNIYVENYAYKLATKRFSDVMYAMQQLLFMRFDKRLALFLSEEAIDDNVHMTHEQIGRDLNSAREVVTRMLNRFSDDGIVKITRGCIVITDHKKLNNIIAS
ncbi:MAG: Crp/Fnr family transcriptional regulator [Bacillota bacterium]|nr:Crp/Fnr family transcriptional regulator [Bacillota bacterium]